MNINIRDVLTLSDDKEYVVISKVYYNRKDYLYLVDINDNSNLKFCYLENDELIESNNKEINTELLPLFFGKVKNIFSDDKI